MLSKPDGVEETAARQSHAVKDLVSRKAKGLKIERLLNLPDRRQPFRLLDIGTGSGGVAHYFCKHDTLRCEVTSVDVVDQREIFDGYTFIQLEGTKLPFEDASFDIVISNHVIEHVGGKASQVDHLHELHRVLTLGGLGYIAVPNRWMLVEPHYRLAFLSWFPHSLRTPYLRFMNKGFFYDCEPLTVVELEAMLDEVGFIYTHLHIESIREAFSIEGLRGWARWIATAPDWLLMLLRRLTPTLIYRVKR